MKNKKPFPKIETDRLILRELSEEDHEMISFLRSDPIVNQFVKRTPASTKEEALNFIEKCRNQFDNGKTYQWGITIKPDNKIVGCICLWNISKEGKKAEIGYDLDPNHQKKGIMDEALKNVLDFGFNNLSVEMIDAYTQKNNPDSIKLLERNGFKRNTNRIDEENEMNWIYELYQ